MKETKEVKVKFSTAICIILIVLLIAGCGLLYYFGFVQKSKQIETAQSEKIVQEAKIKELEAKITELEEKNEKNTKTSNIANKNEIIKLIDELAKNTEETGLPQEIYVSGISKEANNQYKIKAYYNAPIVITEEEYKDLVATGDCEKYLGVIGKYVESSDAYGGDVKYGFIESHVEDGNTITYIIDKTSSGYAFRFPAGPGYPLSTETPIDEFYLDENTKVYDGRNDEEKMLKEYGTILGNKFLQKEVPIVTVAHDENNNIYLYESAK